MNSEEFLTRVVPSIDGAFYNAHHLNHMEPNKVKAFGGRAYKSVAEVVKYARWANSKQWSAYFACSAQIRAEVKAVSNGRDEAQYKAIRNAVNAAGMKALWIDIDLKEGYEDIPSILRNIKGFCAATHLPGPTIAVSTGNGVHFYWCTKETMEPTVWRVLAESLKQAALNHGLKFDAGCTTDAARVLRVPGTSNWKDPSNPKPVTIMGALKEDHDLKTLQDALAPYYQPIQPGPTLPPGMGDMTAGLSTEARPVPFADVLPECEVLRHTVATGGKDDNEPAWYRAVMAATYAEDGLIWAQAMSAGHPDYDPAAVAAKFDQALRAREQNDLGWPRCQKFAEQNGDKCGNCKHFAKGRSPLNFRYSVENAKPADQQSPQPVADLPAPYVRHPTLGTIYVPMQSKSKDDDEVAGAVINVPVLDYPLYDAELILMDDKTHLRFIAHVPKAGFAKPQIVSLSFDKLSDKRTCCNALTTAGVVVSAAYQDRVREFLVAWVKQLQLSTTMTIREAYGWVQKDNGEIEGFAYAKHCATPNGPLPVTEPSPSLKAGYSPRGSLEVWKEAAKALTVQKRPQIDAILASAFAAPLTEFAPNCPGLVVSAVSSRSGTGKTSGMRVAQAVWGNPRTEMNALDDTSASVANKIGALRSLPLFWDELRGNEDTLRFCQLIFQVTQGKEKSRMTANLDRRPVGTWETMLIAAANASILERVADASPEGPAGVYRVLEIEVPQIAANQKANFVQFGSVIDKVGTNYGQAGLVYADYLGANATVVRQRVLDMAESIRTIVDGQAEERFWVFAITALLVGAQISVELGLTEIDVRALANHLCRDVFPRLRSTVRAEHVDSGDTNVAAASAASLSDFLLATHGKGAFLATDKLPKPGPKTAQTIAVLTPAPGSMIRMAKPDVHYVVEGGVLRISRTALHAFLQEKKIYRRGFMQTLENELGAKLVTSRLGVGTPYETPTSERLIVLDMNRDELKGIMG